MATEPKPTININLDTTPILYTDRIFITINQFGVVFDVTQKTGNQTRIITRIGMSREHAKKLTTDLGKLLAVTESDTKTKQN
ncbi:TPA: hypothetical protein DIV55_07175 [Patescibacteria group bacterium]|uniref:DUF3467 domain-containing protein n=1 Tax=Candidatus Gottesmanbacteria bacterium GW2011_GWA1_43_11 TaxID=1618436 RepID=A0A0G1FEN8_9BACT|nr:MAG: hypothetical protein UV59_C0008G0011 [Candidatus Gottesmanbacteria bacterium GW2011_GWA1_43_11]HCS79484.1 hypothetical protein [Patescibacteria group bacterium]